MSSKVHPHKRSVRHTEPDRSKAAWLARILILAVVGWNLQCALLFMNSPASYAGGFNLSGESGATVVRSLGLLFLMWNIPYLFALVKPYGWKVCLLSAVIQQGIGLIGEIWIKAGAADAVTQASITRFIQFDAAGLVLLLGALILVQLKRQKEGQHHV